MLCSQAVDENALFTELNLALQSEDYGRAARIRDALRRASPPGEAPTLLDWHAYDIPAWLCERAEQLGWRYPTGAAQAAALGCRYKCMHVRLALHVTSSL